MLKGYNEEEIATDFPSIRRKYQGGRFGRSKINYGSVLNTHKKEITSNTEVKPIIKEEKIIIKEETKVNRDIVAASPNETSSKITRTVIKDDNKGKEQKQITITKTEIKETQSTQNTQNNSRNASRLRENKELLFLKLLK